MEGLIYSITELTRQIKQTIEQSPHLNSIWISGEVTNVTYHSSGHIYFTLKDEGAVIQAVFFRYANKGLAFKLTDGQSVFAQGGVTVFEKRGSYQFIVARLRLEGIGELQKRIELLKKKLLAEGIFDAGRKRSLPVLPVRVGVVTSPTGAAFRDIVKVAMRRFPNIEILLVPALVQGPDAPESIARAIDEANNPAWGIDVIIAGRGGGSFEDLMPFNEEVVVRAFYGSRIPIISAVGHQIDHPLCDDAADVAAPTPSAAAELAIPVRDDIEEYIDFLGNRAYTALVSMVREYDIRITTIESRRVFKRPMELIHNRALLLHDLEGRLGPCMKNIIALKKNQLLAIPDPAGLMKSVLTGKKHLLSLRMQALEKLSPAAILKRGYAITRDASGTVIRSIGRVHAGGQLCVQYHDGQAECTVNQTIPGGGHGEKKSQNQF